MKRLLAFVPAVGWLRTYDRRADLPGDVSAGLTVAVMLIPQAMAYAMLAGLPPIVGLYASVLPLFAYALLGTSRQLAVGPVAMVSLLVASGLGGVAEPGSERYVALAVVLAGLVGAIQLGMGVLRLGRLVTLLSHPVIAGFTSAAAIVIALSQLGHLLGVELGRSARLHELVAAAVPRLGDTHLITLALGAAAIAVLLVVKKRWPRLPGALIVVALGTLATFLLRLDEAGVRIVGAVPAGLPSPSLPAFELADLGALAPTAVAIALVGFMESISVAKAFARKNRYAIDANQELIGLGAANLAGFGFGGYPVTGGFSRTAVNAQAGARTGLATAITAAVIAVSLLFLTPLFHFLPKAVLAAIVMVAVAGLVDLRELGHLWHVKRTDAVLWLVTFAGTLFFGIEEGIAAGVVLSIAIFVRRSTRPHHAVLGRLPGTRSYRNVKHFPEAETVEGVLVWRFDASLYFANASFFREEVDRLLLDDAGVRAVVLDASGINDLDASGEALLSELHTALESRAIRLYVANVKGPVREVLARGGFTAALGEDRFFFDLHEAVEAAIAGLAPAGEPASEARARSTSLQDAAPAPASEVGTRSATG
ncbi:MAG: solute carrier family 26 protein [Sandaracinaceae bacterium]|nr:solute carrier family 26 protein [Sandaracinaceae bacterium]